MENNKQVVLFVKLEDGAFFTDDLVKKISGAVRSNCSPRHVPAVIKAVPDIPYTINGKKVEIAVKKIIHGIEVQNKDALANPESLDYFENILN